ncbi:MAG TPA: hypothetical protein VGG27_13970 [Magnetospirillaceae bacterium]|jgi:hypothetical protein
MKISRIIAAIVFAGFAGGAVATPAFADWHRDHDRHWHDPHWHDPHCCGGPGVVIAQPPVVYAAPQPYYAPPPPMVGLGLDVHIR